MTTTALCILLVSLLGVVVGTSAADKTLARGFGDDIVWMPYHEGLELAQQLGKPLFLLLHKSWCGACKR